MHFRIAIIMLIILFNSSISCYDFCDKQYYNSDGNVLVEKTLNCNNTLYLFRNQTALGKPRLLQWNYKELDMEPIEAGKSKYNLKFKFIKLFLRCSIC